MRNWGEFISRFSLESFHDPDLVRDYVNFFEFDKFVFNCDEDSIPSKQESLGSHMISVIPNESKPFEIKYDDLARLHYLILKRKVLITLEFGSGYSTVIIAHANSILMSDFYDLIKDEVRVDNPFHVYAIEEEQRFLETSQKRLSDASLALFATVSRSSVDMILHDGRIASVYSRLPNVSPDFIYLDGPSQYATTTDMNGFNFNSPCRMPMSADILRFEFFLEPGTLILIDGRTANARFLRSYLKRNWNYIHDPVGDVHYLELVETPLGKHNKAKIDFCLGSSFYENL